MSPVLLLAAVLVAAEPAADAGPDGMTGFYAALGVLALAIARELQHRKARAGAPKCPADIKRCAFDGADRDSLLGELREHTVLLHGLREDLRERLPVRRAS